MARGFVDHYKEHKIPRNADPATLREQWEAYLNSYKPGENSKADKALPGLREAMEILTDPERKKTYDVNLEAASAAEGRFLRFGRNALEKAGTIARRFLGRRDRPSPEPEPEIVQEVKPHALEGLGLGVNHPREEGSEPPPDLYETDPVPERSRNKFFSRRAEDKNVRAELNRLRLGQDNEVRDSLRESAKQAKALVHELDDKRSETGLAAREEAVARKEQDLKNIVDDADKLRAREADRRLDVAETAARKDAAWEEEFKRSEARIAEKPKWWKKESKTPEVGSTETLRLERLLNRSGRTTEDVLPSETQRTNEPVLTNAGNGENKG